MDCTHCHKGPLDLTKARYFRLGRKAKCEYCKKETIVVSMFHDSKNGTYVKPKGQKK